MDVTSPTTPASSANQRLVAKAKTKRKARQEKKQEASGSTWAKDSALDYLKATVAAQKKLLTVKETQIKVAEVTTASKIILDDDEGIDQQAAALQAYLTSIKANSVKLGSMVAAIFERHTSPLGIIDPELVLPLSQQKNKSATFYPRKNNWKPLQD